MLKFKRCHGLNYKSLKIKDDSNLDIWHLSNGINIKKSKWFYLKHIKTQLIKKNIGNKVNHMSKYKN